MNKRDCKITQTEMPPNVELVAGCSSCCGEQCKVEGEIKVKAVALLNRTKNDNFTCGEIFNRLIQEYDVKAIV